MRLSAYKIFILCAAFYLFSWNSVSAQIGGTYTYGLLNLNTAARSGAMGGALIASTDPDVSLVNENPAYLGLGINKQLSLNYVNYFADINYGRVAYSQNTKKLGNFSASLFYLNYGNFIEANEYGEITGEFQAAEYTFDIAWGYRIDSILSVGLAVRPIYSVLERYNSWGIAADAAIMYLSPGQLTAASLVLRNVGTQLSTYYSPNREALPFEVLAGFSQKIKHAPFRLSFTLRNLQRFNLDVIQPGDETDPATGLKLYKNKFQEYALKSLDHLVAAVEFVPGKVVHLRFGYNFRNRAEMKLGTRNTASGLTFGLGLNLGRFNIDYALANYHLAGVSHLLSLTTHLTISKDRDDN